MLPPHYMITEDHLSRKYILLEILLGKSLLITIGFEIFNLLLA